MLSTDLTIPPVSKIPILAFLLSLIYPGIGHIYAGRRKRGIFFAALTVLALLPPVYFVISSEAKSNILLLIPFPIMIFLSIFLAVEAYGHARDHNKRHQLSDGLSRTWPRVIALAVIYVVFVILSIDRVTRFAAENVALPFMIGSRSMEPRYTTDELYLLDKRAYQKSSPQRGDVVLFSLPGVFGDDFVKRVVGLGGETIEIRSGNIQINGRPVAIPGAEGLAYRNEGPLARPGMVLRIPAGQYFLLGDNSGHSIDSRYWGPLEREYIHGKVLPIARPWNRYGAALKRGIDDFAVRLERLVKGVF